MNNGIKRIEKISHENTEDEKNNVSEYDNDDSENENENDKEVLQNLFDNLYNENENENGVLTTQQIFEHFLRNQELNRKKQLKRVLRTVSVLNKRTHSWHLLSKYKK